MMTLVALSLEDRKMRVGGGERMSPDTQDWRKSQKLVLCTQDGSWPRRRGVTAAAPWMSAREEVLMQTRGAASGPQLAVSSSEQARGPGGREQLLSTGGGGGCKKAPEATGSATRLNVEAAASLRGREHPRILENTQVMGCLGPGREVAAGLCSACWLLFQERSGGYKGVTKREWRRQRSKGKSILTCRSEVSLFPSLRQSNRRQQTPGSFQSAREGRGHTRNGWRGTDVTAVRAQVETPAAPHTLGRRRGPQPGTTPALSTDVRATATPAAFRTLRATCARWRRERRRDLEGSAVWRDFGNSG
ncbi:uncharacterized protein LOC118150284 [Callithrix jacchus]|uniref:uncharacterized protein LOC118150284 n=1 Tax=Callithrix jacchus TaxID=9483 RepID=UPI00159D0BA9|nr:uncharacterized protein LOC118150284 [Callithrix jacchus]